jgi:hypothetical protein
MPKKPRADDRKPRADESVYDQMRHIEEDHHALMGGLIDKAEAEAGGGVDPGPGPEPDLPPPNLWVLPAQTGSGDGSSPENAAPWSKIPTLIAAGKVIGLIADKGEWTGLSSLSLSKGGTEDNPCTIRGTGQDGKAKKLALKSGREQPLLFEEPGSYPGGSGDTLTLPREEWAQGSRGSGITVFNCNKGADWLVFSHFAAKDINAFADFKADVTGHTYRDIDLWNVKHGWTMEDDPASGSTVERCIQKMLWERFSADYFEEDCFRWRGLSHHLEARDFSINSRRCMGHISFGFNIGTGDDARNDKVTDWKIQKGIILNVHDTHYNKPWCKSVDAAGNPVAPGYAPLPGTIRNPKEWKGEVPGTDYWNGDGISVERNCNRGLIEDMEISGCTDAAIDCKAGEVTFRRVHTFDNKRNFRLYAPGLTMEECTSESANKRGGSGGPAHVYLKGGDASGKPGAELVLKNCHFKAPPGSAFSWETEYKWGLKVSGTESCTYDGVTANTPPYIP